MNTAKKATRHSCHYTAPTSTLVRKDYISLSQLEEQRRRRENFNIGSYGAAAALCAMFVVLSIGCVMGLW